MLDALVWDGALSKRAGVMEASGKVQARHQSSTKCAFILNCVKPNACDDRKPSGYQLPQLSSLGTPFCWEGGRSYIWQNWICLSAFGVCACLGGALVNSVYVWEMPNMFGGCCRLGGSTHHSCVSNLCTL